MLSGIYPTSQPGTWKIFAKTTRKLPNIFLTFLLGRKTSRSRSLSVILNVLLLTLFPSSCPEWIRDFESVIKRYFARQWKSPRFVVANAAVTMMYRCTIFMMYIANDTPPKYRILIGYWRHPLSFTTSHMVSVNMAQLLLSRWDVDQAIRLKTSYSQQNIIINNWKLLNKTLTHAIVYGLMVDYNSYTPTKFLVLWLAL